MRMSSQLRQVKQMASKLSVDELNHLVGWFYRLAEKKQRDNRSDTSAGIPPKSVLKAFRCTLPIRCGRICLDAGLGATAMGKFYEGTRVKGCRFEDDADMLLVQWGFDDDQPFLSFTRQIIPPQTKDEIWQLTLDFRYPPSKSLKGLRSGNRRFRSLHEMDAYSRFVNKPGIVTKFENVQPSRVSLTYQNVE